MQIIPAVDLRKGQCVRLTKGKLENETVFSKDPCFMANLWQAKGAKRLHVVDLDGAFSGVMQNLKIIKEIRKKISIPMQVGGGIRDLKTIKKVLSMGVDKVILGTVTISNPDLVKKSVAEFGKKIIVSVDSQEGKVAIGGWKDITAQSAFSLTEQLIQAGVSEIIFTDVSKDGTLEGPNIKVIKKTLQKLKTNVSIIIAGGMAKLEDVRKIKKLEELGVTGVIIGKALYTEDIKIEEAIKIAEGKEFKK
ncbi:1-(5-phosphoribosyl)-5-[(5-phosphoribosylamino)methylideneamino]imidazole-4-carboxamide isomerase [bacterium]|nr:1-(5-phosphoribosyl)-5-[(5-phosphoribosylamino)methylideneamino]imidazole-4-carboxamide isomerase [bacterium]